MSTAKVITIVCWVITALALTGLVIWFLTGSLFGGWADRWQFGFNTGGWEMLTGPYETDGTYNIDADGIDSIKVDWVAGDITLVPYDGNDIQINELAQRKLNDNEKLRISTSGGTLEIRFHENSIGRINMPQKQLEIFVPHGLGGNLDKLTVNSVSGSIDVKDVSAGVLSIETTSAKTYASGTFGNVKLTSVSGNISLNNTAHGSGVGVNTTSGSINISGAFDEVVAESVSGSVEVTSTLTPASFKAETVSGNITITLPGDASISIHHTSVSGRLTSEIPVTMEGRGAEFRISTVSGNSRIQALG